MRTAVKYAYLLLIVTTIVSCGGSGGGKTGNNNNSTSPSSISSQITSSSSSTVAITHFRKITGDNQTQIPGNAVPIEPMIDVLDSNQAPVAGVSVTFAVTMGNGNIQHINALTDSSGRASSGAWTLGENAGINKITASINGFEPLTFLAKAAHSSADLSIFVSMYKNQGFGDDYRLSSAAYLIASVRSTYLIEEVTFNVDGTSCKLTYVPDPPNYSSYWYCPIDLLAGRPSGPVTLIATAKDAMGNIANSVVLPIMDRAPTLSIQPLNGSVIHSTSTNINIICTDDFPSDCAQTDVTITYPGREIILQGISSIDQSVDLSTAVGQGVTLSVSGIDQGGTRTNRVHTFYVEPDQRLSTLAYISDGIIWDASDSKVLFLDTSVTPRALKILDIASNATKTIETSDDFEEEETGINWRRYGFLTPSGAIYQRRVPPPTANDKQIYSHLYEWDGTALHELDLMSPSADTIRTNGKWAIYQTKANAWWLRNTETRQSTLITENGLAYGVAANGDVVYRDSDSTGNLYRFRNNASQVLASNTNSFGGQINETHVAYVKTNGSTHHFAMHDGTTETVLAESALAAPVEFLLAGEYIAYKSNNQIWRYGPIKNEQITVFSLAGSLKLEATTSTGAILMTHDRKRYLSLPDKPLENIGSASGKVIVNNDRIFLIKGQTVMEFNQ